MSCSSEQSFERRNVWRTEATAGVAAEEWVDSDSLSVDRRNKSRPSTGRSYSSSGAISVFAEIIDSGQQNKRLITRLQPSVMPMINAPITYYRLITQSQSNAAAAKATCSYRSAAQPPGRPPALIDECAGHPRSKSYQLLRRRWSWAVDYMNRQQYVTPRPRLLSYVSAHSRLQRCYYRVTATNFIQARHIFCTADVQITRV